MSKKGLLVIYSPQHLIQFVWYYSTFGYHKKWDVLCLPNGFSADLIESNCKNSKIFDNTIISNDYYLKSSIFKQMSLFFKMLFFFCIGKKKKYLTRFLSNYINPNLYDEINVLSDFGIVSGAFVGLSDEYNVVIMEDGFADYRERSYKNLKSKKLSFLDIKGVLLSFMGYANINGIFPLKQTKNCIKFSSMPQNMIYTDYKSIDKLFDFTKTNLSIYYEATKNIYNESSFIDALNGAQAIIFTTTTSEYAKNTKCVTDIFADYINKKYNCVAIKKHPRDKTTYDFGKNVDCRYIDQIISAEVLIPYLKDVDIIFMDISSTIMHIPESYNIECVYFNELYSKGKKEKTEHYLSKKEFISLLNSFGKTNYIFTEL